MFKFAPGICVFALAAAALQAQTNLPVPVTRTTGMVGIAEGQTAQLNALNPGVAPPALGVICSALLSFVTEDGTVLKTKTVSVAPGTSQSIVIDSVKDLALATDERKQIRAAIAIPAPNTATPACKLIGTLEIFNTLDGRTQVTLGTVHEIPSPVATPGT